MTDREIAIELGVRLIKAKLTVEAIGVELDLSRDASGLRRPWRHRVDQITEEILTPAARERIEELTLALQAAKPDALLQTLQKSLQELL